MYTPAEDGEILVKQIFRPGTLTKYAIQGLGYLPTHHMLIENFEGKNGCGNHDETFVDKYTECGKPELMHTDTQLELLDEIHTELSDSVSTENYEIIFTMIESILFQTDYPILLESDVEYYQTVLIDPAVLICYKILEKILCVTSFQKMSQTLIELLCQRISSVLKFEREKTKLLLNTMLKISPKIMRPHLMRCIRSRHISSELFEILTEIFKSSQSFSKRNIDFYKHEILDIYLEPNLPRIEPALTNFLFTFLNHCSECTEFTISYLELHWPITSAEKQPIYIFLIGRLTYYFERILSKETVQSILIFIAKHANSELLEVSERVIDIFISPQYLKLLQNHAQFIYGSILLPIFRCSREHWDIEVRKNMADLLEYLKRASPKEYEIYIRQIEDNFSINTKDKLNCPTILNWEFFNSSAKIKQSNPNKHT